MEQDLLELPVLYLSRAIIGRKADYYRLLLAVTTRDAWDDRILFMLRAVAETAKWTTERTGHMATQSMKRDRPATASTISARSNNISFVNGYHVYFGTYTVDERAATMTHRIDGALSPADVGKVLTRQIRLFGDDLTIEFRTLSTDGVQVTRVKWKRVG